MEMNFQIKVSKSIRTYVSLNNDFSIERNIGAANVYLLETWGDGDGNYI